MTELPFVLKLPGRPATDEERAARRRWRVENRDYSLPHSPGWGWHHRSGTFNAMCYCDYLHDSGDDFAMVSHWPGEVGYGCWINIDSLTETNALEFKFRGLESIIPACEIVKAIFERAERCLP